MPAKSRVKKLRVAVTGASGSIGRLALPKLLASEQVESVLALDLSEPDLEHAKLRFAAVDLSRSSAVGDLTRALKESEIGCVVHLAFFSKPVRDSAFAHEVEAVGTGKVLTACAAAGIKALVMSSSTFVYGAEPTHPNFLTEDRPLVPHPQSRFVADRIEAEVQVRAFRKSHPALRSVVLRFAPIVGPSVDTPITRYLGGPVAPMALGHDPLVQCVHEDDVAEALLLSVLSNKRGDFNICGRGVLPLSTVLHLCGARPLPLPLPLATAALKALNALGITAVPPRLIDYLRYLWVADGQKAERELHFRPRHSTREAILSFAQARGSAGAA
ncbi:MAG TPA: NAD-dependent epimerase/dehydratase family protein [Myxococcales bacterium]|jgi:UDP-glucose 4-epimerase